MGILAAWANKGQAASFDCAKANTPIERTICADAGLSWLDDRLGVAFSQSEEQCQNSAQLQHGQVEWLSERNDCINRPNDITYCIIKSYLTRLDALPKQCVAKVAPNQWGAILPLPEWANWGGSPFYGTYGTGNDFVSGKVYKNDEGDVIVTYYFYVEKKQIVRFYNLTKGILGPECTGYDITVPTDANIVDSICYKSQTAKLQELRPVKKIKDGLLGFHVGNGQTFLADSEAQPCTMDAGYNIISDADGSTLRHEKIIWIPNKARINLRADRCAMPNGFRTILFTRAISLNFFDFYRLDDNRLLGLSYGAPVVIIFNNDLTSPFFDGNKSFFVVDAKKIDKAYDECSYVSSFSSLIYLTDSELELADECIINFIRREQK
jgi:uncharacterized protein YecT (DUF1311 family)